MIGSLVMKRKGLMSYILEETGGSFWETLGGIKEERFISSELVS